MDKRSQTDHEDRVVPHEDTRLVDVDSDSIQAILYQLLEKTNEMASRLDRILERADRAQTLLAGTENRDSTD